MDPSDILVAHAPEHGALRTVTLELLLDYQGGGLSGSAARSDWLRSVPTPHEQELIGQVAGLSLEAFITGATSPESLRGAISRDAADLFAPHVSPASLAFRGLAATSAAAFVSTVQRSSMDEAAMVLLMGCTLLQKANGWSALREQGK